jgi:lysophospholipase L1-like esterase
MKPSPSRWHLADKMKAGNEGIKNFLQTQKNTGFVNVWESMLNKNHGPDGNLFLEDSLHMNANGYRIWQTLIKPELIEQ